MKINSNLTAEQAQGFGIYHFGWGGRHDPAMLKKYEDLGIMNTYPVYGDDDKLREAAAAGAKFWIYNHGPLLSENVGGVNVYSLKDGWKDDIARTAERYRKLGVWDAILGFDYDEPMLQSTNEIVEAVAEETAKYGKRQLAIFSYYEVVEGSHPSYNDPEFGKTAHIINPQSCRFFTDIAFDYYGSYDYGEHKTLSDTMKRRAGGNPHVWYVPSTWSLFNRFGQEHAIRHLETCYRLLKEEQNPGGLICYNWHSFEGVGESLDWLFADENKSRWSLLESRMIEIANEIIKIPLKG